MPLLQGGWESRGLHPLPAQRPGALSRGDGQGRLRQVSLGFESGAVSVLKEMNKRFEPEEVRIISARLAAHGIRRMGFLLLGGPGETRETVEESVAFADSSALEMLNVTIGIRIYPQTALARIAIEEGMLDPKDDLLHPRFYLRPELETCIRDIVGIGDNESRQDGWRPSCQLVGNRATPPLMAPQQSGVAGSPYPAR